MRYLIRILIGAYLCSLVVGCSDDKPTRFSGTDEFPQAVGSHWTYLYSKPGSPDLDTVDVEITTQSVGSQGAGTVWTVTSRTGQYGIYDDLFHAGESYVVVRGDSVRFYDERPGSPPYMTLLLPLAVGKSWDTPTPATSDATSVTANEALAVPAGAFPNAWKLERALVWEDCWLDCERWFVSNVGFVKGEAAVGGAVCFGGTSSWELLSYTIPDSD